MKICSSEAVEICSCDGDPANFQSVNNSTRVIFHFTGLQAHTTYCMQSIGIYRIIERLRSVAEVTRGESISIQTDGKK